MQRNNSTREAPREAFEFASVIPNQLLADEDAQGRALGSGERGNPTTQTNRRTGYH